jgi:thiol-disulfide isomerase/thioredoxin
MELAKKALRQAVRWLGFAAVAAVLILAILNSGSGLPEGSAAPSIVGSTIDGERFSTIDFAGRPVVLNFWATWCPPCLAELPDLERAFQSYGDRVAFVGLTLESGSPQEVAEVVRRYKLTYPIVLPHPRVQQAYKVTSFPTTVILGPDGKVVHSHAGSVDFDILTRELRPYLAGQS